MKTFTTLLCCFFVVLGTAHTQIYIDQNASGNNDGTSWENAYTNPQDAFDNAETDDEIWITSGIYKPQINALPDSNWYYINTPLSLYGGFLGMETSLDQRDWEANPTIWDADILGDDIDDDFETNRADNAFHLLVGEITGGTLTLDGLVITGGNALDEDLPPTVTDGRPYRGAVDIRGNVVIRNCIFERSKANAGGALFLVPDTTSTDNFVSLENCTFENNFALYGGGAIIQLLENMTVEDCSFENNNAPEFGGGLFLFGIISGSVNNCTFDNNRCEFLGGGLLLGNSNVTVADCIFDANEVPASSLGGGIFIYQNSFNLNPYAALEIERCDFTDNIAGAGAGLCYNNFFPESYIEIDSCFFAGNRSNFANNNGGAGFAIQNFFDNINGGISSLDVDINNCTLEDNTSYLGGAGFFYSSQATIDVNISNTAFRGNTSDTDGGGLHSIGDNSGINLNILNSIFQNNNAVDGGAISNTGLSNTILTNVLVTENEGNQAIWNIGNMDFINCSILDNGEGVNHFGAGSMSFQNTVLSNFDLNVDGVLDNITSLGGNLSSDMSLESVFIETGTYPDFNNTPANLDMDYMPLNISACVDNGNPTDITATTDLVGETRIQGAQIDIGAFESGFSIGLSQVNNKRVKVFPNPFVESLNISEVDGLQEIRLLSAQGQLVQTYSPNGQVLVSPELSSGTYFLELIYEDYQLVEKVEKLK